MIERIHQLEKRMTQLENIVHDIQQLLVSKKNIINRSIQKETPFETLNPEYSMFHKAYTEIAKQTQELVLIHQIRKSLKWEDSQFNTVIQNLLDDTLIQLHHGDMTQLSIRDLGESYIDNDGQTFIYLSWISK